VSLGTINKGDEQVEDYAKDSILAACLVDALKLGREGMTIYVDPNCGGLAYHLAGDPDGYVSSGGIGPDGDSYSDEGWWVDGERNGDAYDLARSVMSDLERSGFTVNVHD
jgi:hypothetical protein